MFLGIYFFFMLFNYGMLVDILISYSNGIGVFYNNILFNNIAFNYRNLF